MSWTECRWLLGANWVEEDEGDSEIVSVVGREDEGEELCFLKTGRMDILVESVVGIKGVIGLSEGVGIMCP